MKPIYLPLRFFLVKEGDLWVASCVDLCLAAQHEDQQRVRENLAAQVDDHIRDRLDAFHAEFGLDRELDESDIKHLRSYILRPAPLSIRVQYYWLIFMSPIYRMFQHLVNRWGGAELRAQAYTMNSPVPSCS